MENDKKLIELKNLVEAAEISLQQARTVLISLVGSQEEKLLAGEAKKIGTISAGEGGQVIEGIFDGQNMLGPDEKKYSVPANYASKSKLVEGDSLKLTITADGSFVYKQINLLDRDRLVGQLSIDDKTNEFRVLANNKSYRVLTASITYYKGEAGDKVTILVPKGKESTWAAVENIFKPGEEPVAVAVVEKAGDEQSDEFLSQEAGEDKEDKEDKKAEKVEATPQASNEKPEDIFQAVKSVKTDNVTQLKEQPQAEVKDEQGLGLSNQLRDDLNQAQDKQGLEEL